MTLQNRLPTFSAALLVGLERLINKALALDPLTCKRLSELSDKRICLRPSFGMALQVIPGSNGLRLSLDDGGEVDVELSGSPLSLLKLISPPNIKITAAELQQKHEEISVKGDEHLAVQLQNILVEAEPDWEELFARYFGNLPAHTLGNGVRGGIKHSRLCLDAFRHNLDEYLHEEIRLLPGRAEIEAFQLDMVELRESAEALEERMLFVEKTITQLNMDKRDH